MKPTLAETLLDAHRYAQCLTGSIRSAHETTCHAQDSRETIANAYLLQLIKEAADLENKIKAILP